MSCKTCIHLDQQYNLCSCKHSPKFGWDGSDKICAWYEGDDTYDHDREKQVAYIDERSDNLEQSHYDRLGDV